MIIFFYKKRINLSKPQKDVTPLKVRPIEKFNKIIKPV